MSNENKKRYQIQRPVMRGFEVVDYLPAKHANGQIMNYVDANKAWVKMHELKATRKMPFRVFDLETQTAVDEKVSWND